MALTAENLAVKYNIDRQTVDKFALRSQQNWKKGSHDFDVVRSDGDYSPV